MKNEFDAEKVLSKMEVERSQNEFDIYSIIKKYGGKGKDHSWADELKENDAKPSYLSEIETENRYNFSSRAFKNWYTPSSYIIPTSKTKFNLRPIELVLSFD